MSTLVEELHREASHSDDKQEPADVTNLTPVSGVVSFLRNHGITERFCEAFEENYIDGAEFLTLTESEVKSLVPPIGLARKIMRIIPHTQERQTIEQHTQVQDSTCQLVLTSPLPSPPLLPTSPPSSLASGGTSSTPTSRDEQISIPDHWRPEIEQCIKDQRLTDSARNDMVRSLVNQLFVKSNKPIRYQCESLARKLILRHPFLKDDLGNGYQSWADKMVERLRNVIKHDNRKSKRALAEAGDDTEPEPKHKRSKKESEILRRYPLTNTVDIEEKNPDTLERYRKAIATEMEKSKPRDSILLTLMRSTYGERRMFVLNAASVHDILIKHPALHRPAVIDQEMGLIIGQADIKTRFLQKWTTEYVPAIISYGETSTKKSISRHLVDLEETDDTSRQLAAMKILAECLGTGRQESLCYIYEEYEAMDTVEIACNKPPVRTQPAFIGEGNVQYFILCEQQVLCKVPTLQIALFTAFAAYYCITLQYPLVAKNMLSFLQDYILGHPDSNKKSGAYLGIVSDIKRHL